LKLDGTWQGYVDVPLSVPTGTGSIIVSGAADSVGNVMADHTVQEEVEN